MELSNDVYNSVERYYNTLKYSGYKSYEEVYKLLIYIFIEELLTGELSEYVTHEDYDIISKILYYLYGTCMIPYPDYKKAVTSITPLINEYRLTENKEIRIADNYIRIKA